MQAIGEWGIEPAGARLETERGEQPFRVRAGRVRMLKADRPVAGPSSKALADSVITREKP